MAETRYVVLIEGRVQKGGFTGLKHEHVKTREFSHEIFYSEIQSLREVRNCYK